MLWGSLAPLLYINPLHTQKRAHTLRSKSEEPFQKKKNHTSFTLFANAKLLAHITKQKP
jgi:hypothetical protein